MPAPAPQPNTELDPDFLEQLLDTIAETMQASAKDTDRARAARRSAARLALLALRPGDPFQAMLAAQAIAAHYAIMDAFRRAMQPDLAPAMAARLRASAATLARTMEATLRTLRQHQTTPTDQDAVRSFAAAHRPRAGKSRARSAPNSARPPGGARRRPGARSYRSGCDPHAGGPGDGDVAGRVRLPRRCLPGHAITGRRIRIERTGNVRNKLRAPQLP